MSMEQQAEAAAAEFMRQKGYPKADPHDVEKIEDLDVWYFYYDLPEGTLELEVEWNGVDWIWGVMNFIHFRDQDEQTLVASGR